MHIGIPELLVILAIVVVLFGARRLPEIGSGLAGAIKGFRKGVSDDGKAGAAKSSDDKGADDKSGKDASTQQPPHKGDGH